MRQIYISIPDKSQYSTYTLKMVDSEIDRLFGLFCPEGYGSYTPEDHDYYMVYAESSGKKLAVYENAICYSAFNIDIEASPMQTVETLMYYHSQEFPKAVPHDLSFMSVDEMEAFGKDFL